MRKQKYLIIKNRSNIILQCIFIHLTVCISSLFGQNIVINSSFETFSTCPNNIGQVNLATGWFNVPSHPGNPDYLNTCATVSTIDVPANAFGTQTAATGNGYLGIVLYYQATPNWREYIETQLTSPMVAGQNYTIQFKTSLGDQSQFSSPAFQFYFSNTIFNCVFCGSPITTVIPQVSSTTHVTSKTAWTTVTANYTAVGGEQFMTIGNFRNDATTPVTPAGSGLYSTVYYYIDDFSVTPTAPLPVELAFYNVECKNKNIQVNWTTVTEINNNYFTVETSNDCIDFTKVENVDGAGNSNQAINYSYTLPYNHTTETYVRLTQTDFDGKVHIFSTKYISCNNLELEACPTIELKGDQLNIYTQNSIDDELSIEIYTYDGHCVSKFNTSTLKGENLIQHNVDELPSGIYFIQITGADKYCSSKIFIEN